MKKISINPIVSIGMFLIIAWQPLVIQGQNLNDPSCVTARKKVKQAIDYADAFCQQNKDYYPVTPPPDVDPECPMDTFDFVREIEWRNSICKIEKRLLRELIGAEKDCQLNCPPNSCDALTSNAFTGLLKRMEKTNRVLLKTYGKDWYKFMAVIRCVISMEKQIAMLGAEDASTLAEIGSYVDWGFKEAVRRRIEDHNYRINFRILIGLAKQAALLGGGDNLTNLMDLYWDSQKFELTIDIEAKATQTDGDFTGMDYNIQGKTILYLNRDHFFDGFMKEVWEPGKIYYTYQKRKITGGNNLNITCQTPETYTAPFFFEFLPSCESFLKGNWEVAAEFERFTPLYETFIINCISTFEDECKSEPSDQSVTLPDGTVQRIEKYANGDGKLTNSQNLIEGLIRGALKDTLEAAQKRAAKGIQTNQKKFVPPANMNDTAAYNKWMREIQKSMDLIREGQNTRFYPALQNKNPEAVDFTFKVPQHIKDDYEGDMDVTIHIKLTHKPGIKIR